MTYGSKRKRKRTQDLRVKYLSTYEKMSPKEKFEANRRLESTYDFIFKTTLEDQEAESKNPID